MAEFEKESLTVLIIFSQFTYCDNNPYCRHYHFIYIILAAFDDFVLFSDFDARDAFATVLMRNVSVVYGVLSEQIHIHNFNNCCDSASDVLHFSMIAFYTR